MRTPIYCGETFEALTIIRLKPWALEMLDQGCVFLRFPAMSYLPPHLPHDRADVEIVTLDICTIRFDPLRLRNMQTWIGVTGDGPTALRLRSVFLPGQQSEVREAERTAQIRLIEKMMKNLQR